MATRRVASAATRQARTVQTAAKAAAKLPWLATCDGVRGGLVRSPLAVVQIGTVEPLALPAGTGTTPSRGVPAGVVHRASADPMAVTV